MITLKIPGRDVRIKADTGTEATVICYNLYTKLTKKPLQKIQQPLKGWLAKKLIHPKGSVSFPTQYKNRKLDVLYLVVEGDFTPLLGCDACLDLEVIKFMNLQLIDTAEKFHTYVYGRRIVVETDHKPLEPIFKKPLNAAPPKIQRMLLKLPKYDLDVPYLPGKKPVI